MDFDVLADGRIFKTTKSAALSYQCTFDGQPCRILRDVPDC
jgi:hypothetical protein